MNGQVQQKEMMEESKEARKNPRAAHLIGSVTKTEDPMETKAKVRRIAKPDNATTVESKGTSE